MDMAFAAADHGFCAAACFKATPKSASSERFFHVAISDFLAASCLSQTSSRILNISSASRSSPGLLLCGSSKASRVNLSATCESLGIADAMLASVNFCVPCRSYNCNKVLTRTLLMSPQAPSWGERHNTNASLFTTWGEIQTFCPNNLLYLVGSKLLSRQTFGFSCGKKIRNKQPA